MLRTHRSLEYIVQPYEEDEDVEVFSAFAF
jgi:hypothetical protein